MKNILILSLSIGLAFISCKSDKQKSSMMVDSQEAESATQKDPAPVLNEYTHNIDVKASKLLWKGHKPTGSHNGSVALKSGGVTYKDNVLSTGSFVFDMTSIIVLDMPQDDEYNQKLVKHLNSPDFFDTVAHPTSSFTITNVATVDAQTTLTGDLTIKGITKSVTFPLSMTESSSGLQLTAATFLIDRTDFNIQYKSKKFFDNLKDKFINDEFEISFEVYLK